MKRQLGTEVLCTLIKYEQRSIVRRGERDESVWRGQKGANVSETVLGMKITGRVQVVN